MFVYVINRDGQPLMPCKPAKASHLLKEGKAKVVRRTPFTIQLQWDCETGTQPVTAGMDTGSKMVGCAATANGQVVYQSEVQLRTDVSKKMKKRSSYRRNRRGRKCRYRPARWLNQASMKKEGGLAPSIRSKVESHYREKNFIESILPVSSWILELASFDIHKITNPEVSGVGYQDGNQKGYYNVKAYILNRDGYKCQHCKGKSKDKKLHVHHIIWKSKGGSDEPKNLITLCSECHSELHDGKFELKGKRSKTKHATEIGIVKSQLKKSSWEFEETFGYITKWKREQVLRLSKSHVNDAVAICCGEGEFVTPRNNTYFKRHVAAGDYRQTMGRHSQMRIPTGKLFGIRKFDLISTSRGIGFVKAKRSRGFFIISDLGGNVIHANANVKKDCRRLVARTTTLIEERTPWINPRCPRGEI